MARIPMPETGEFEAADEAGHVAGDGGDEGADDDRESNAAENKLPSVRLQRGFTLHKQEEQRTDGEKADEAQQSDRAHGHIAIVVRAGFCGRARLHRVGDALCDEADESDQTPDGGNAYGASR